MEGKENNRAHRNSNNACNMIYTSIIKKEISLANYVYAQSQKLRALFSDEINLPFNPSKFKYKPIYNDINLLFSFINDEEIIRTKELYTYTNISRKFTLEVKEGRSNLKENFSEALIKALNVQKHLMDSLLLVFEQKMKQIKRSNNIPIIEHELLKLINQVYELQELRTKKLEIIYMVGFINKMSSDKIQPLFDSIEISIRITRLILSSYHFENIHVENSLRQNIISLIKLKNRINLIMEAVIIPTTKIEIIEGEVSKPWLSKNISGRMRREV